MPYADTGTLRAYHRDYYQRNKLKWVERRKRETPEAKAVRARKHREYQLKRQYGLTPQAVEVMLKKQEGKCAVCGTASPGGVNGALHIDHCHVTGRVRGLLCHMCNLRLGWYEKHSSRVAEYLK